VAEHTLSLYADMRVAAADNGTIAYRNASGTRRQFRWIDRSGQEIGTAGDAVDEYIGMPSISPDGRRLAFSRDSDLWLLDLLRGVTNRFTASFGQEIFPVWSPDGTRIAFTSTSKGAPDLYQKAVREGTTEELLLATPDDKFVSDWSPDARHVLYYAYDPKTQHDVWALPVDGEGRPFAVVRTDFEERNAQFSPDGKWVAYQSNESGRFEIYVQPFPGPGAKSRISVSGGAEVRWRRDGKELFYIALDGTLTAVPIRLPSDGKTVEAGAPVPLFLTHMPRAVEHLDGQQYVVSHDGQRFLFNSFAEESSTQAITVILNWHPEPGK
jgi:Tol biopolymer transport system component